MNVSAIIFRPATGPVTVTRMDTNPEHAPDPGRREDDRVDAETPTPAWPMTALPPHDLTAWFSTWDDTDNDEALFV